MSASDKSEHDIEMIASPNAEEPPVVQPEAEKDLTESHLFDFPGEEDHLEQNMPWLGVMTKLLNRWVEFLVQNFTTRWLLLKAEFELF